MCQYTLSLQAVRCAQATRTGLAYIVAQCFGGIVGAAAAFNSLPGTAVALLVHYKLMSCKRKVNLVYEMP